MNRVLHAGCGGADLPADYFNLAECREVKLDINPAMKPDIVASLTDMGSIGEFEGLYCSHTLEHLQAWDVPVALSEFYRVLKPGGLAIIVVPDLEGLEPSDQVLYTTSAGLEVTAFDLFYGHRQLAALNPYMAHRCGFMQRTLAQVLKEAGFEAVVRRIDSWQLLAIATKLS